MADAAGGVIFGHGLVIRHLVGGGLDLGRGGLTRQHGDNITPPTSIRHVPLASRERIGNTRRMGQRNPNRWPTEEWRRVAPTVARMRAGRWEVVSYCRTCHLMMRVDLALVERVSGPGTVLWNRQSRCRRIGCAGIVEFQGKPPDVMSLIRLFAAWPPD